MREIKYSLMIMKVQLGCCCRWGGGERQAIPGDGNIIIITGGT